MKIECPNCNRWYDLPTEPGNYACDTCGRVYYISRTSTPPQATHHCPGCEAAARERDAAYEDSRQMQSRLQRLIDAEPNLEAHLDRIDLLETHLRAVRSQVEIANRDKAAAVGAAKRELVDLRAGILRILADYPRDIKQDAEEALRALITETEAK